MGVKVFKIKFQSTWFFIFTEHNIDVECICSTYKLNIAGYSADEKVTKCHVRGEVSLEDCSTEWTQEN